MAIDTARFVEQLAAAGVRYACGVPDSLLRGLGACLQHGHPDIIHRVACNEGAAVAAAIGVHLAGGGVPLVYLQNSGLGAALNPLASLAAPEVCAVPLLLVIGWRGEIGADGEALVDEPQHRVEGALTPALLDLLSIRHEVVGADTVDAGPVVQRLLAHAAQARQPVALLCRRGAFTMPATLPPPPRDASAPSLLREQAIEACVGALPRGALTVATTGMASRELYALREARGESHAGDFLVVGAMGYASHVALGIADALPGRTVLCLDGDGAALMNLGAFAACARAGRLLHVVLNNDSHESVGDQPTAAPGLRLAAIAAAAGYARVATVRSAGALASTAAEFATSPRAAFIEVLCRVGHRAELGRPGMPPRLNCEQFSAALRAERVGTPR
jgi:phosphonopyruvate decarboxylase